jgi:hypothetical protein
MPGMHIEVLDDDVLGLILKWIFNILNIIYRI